MDKLWIEQMGYLEFVDDAVTISTMLASFNGNSWDDRAVYDYIMDIWG